VNPPLDGPATELVIKTEEKGSDVNLATYLLLDGFDADCEAVVVISNDSDLALPVQAARDRFGLTVGVLNPHERTSWPLRDAATFTRRIRASALRSSQFSAVLHDTRGQITKPLEW